MIPGRLLTTCVALLLVGSGAAPASTIARLDTPLGRMFFHLFDEAKPVTVQNFVRYISTGRYANTFAHRLPQGFVLQGGGFSYTDKTKDVETFEPIVNEAGPFPQYSNVAGTIAMAKLGGNPNSATSQWFINLGDNSANLDNQNGGFTTFGKIVGGEDVLAIYAAFKNYTGKDASRVIINVGSPFDTLPVVSIANNELDTDKLIYTTWTVLPNFKPALTSGALPAGAIDHAYQFALKTDVRCQFSVVAGSLPPGLSLSAAGVISGTPTELGTSEFMVSTALDEEHASTHQLSLTVNATPAPTPKPVAPKITVKKSFVGARGKVTVKGTASADARKIEVRPGKGAFRRAAGSPTRWTFTAKGLKPGRYQFLVRATNAAKLQRTQKVQVTIKN